MSVLAVLVALLLEQARPSQMPERARGLYARWLDLVARNVDAGLERHAVAVWLLAVVLPAAVVAGVARAVQPVSLILEFAWHVGVLYLTLGFRPFSRHFTAIREALEQGDEARARTLLAAWQGVDASELPRTELVRQVIEYAVLASHRHVFGVMFCYVVFAALGLGPAGAVLYRLAHRALRHFGQRHPVDAEPLSPTVAVRAARLWQAVNFVPARLTATGFAIVGNFEEAVAAWRRDADLWADRNDGIVLSAAAGAIGVQLGSTARAPAPTASPGAASPLAAAELAVGPIGGAEERALGAPLGAGAAPQVGHLQSVVGLVWRSVVLWMLLLALLSVANLIG
jgi:adenosylcobinamide-phosphate synthase